VDVLALLVQHGIFRHHSRNETIYLHRHVTYININGLIKFRDHSVNLTRPELCWLLYPGDYITYEIHGEIMENPEIWVKAETIAQTLQVPNEIFL
jgi:hypothetical protein